MKAEISEARPVFGAIKTSGTGGEAFSPPVWLLSNSSGGHGVNANMLVQVAPSRNERHRVTAAEHRSPTAASSGGGAERARV
jgi:hypothetical protein